MVPNCNSTEGSFVSDRAVKSQPKGTEKIPLPSVFLKSCHGRALCRGSFTGNVWGMHTCASWQRAWIQKWMKTVWDSWALWGLRGCQVGHIRSSGPAETSTSPATLSLELPVTALIRGQIRFSSTANLIPGSTELLFVWVNLTVKHTVVKSNWIFNYLYFI